MRHPAVLRWCGARTKRRAWRAQRGWKHASTLAGREADVWSADFGELSRVVATNGRRRFPVGPSCGSHRAADGSTDTACNTCWLPPARHCSQAHPPSRSCGADGPAVRPYLPFVRTGRACSPSAPPVRTGPPLHNPSAPANLSSRLTAVSLNDRFHASTNAEKHALRMVRRSKPPRHSRLA